MRRRHLLAGLSSTALLPLAGCLGRWSEPTSLSNPTVEMDAGGMEKHLVFTRESARQAVITIDQRLKPTSPDQQIPFRLLVWHRDGLRINRLQYELRAPPHPSGVPADIYLDIPEGGPWPEFELRTSETLSTVIAVDEIGELGQGSLGLDLIIDPVGDPVKELAVTATVVFGSSKFLGQQFRASATTQFDILSVGQ